MRWRIGAAGAALASGLMLGLQDALRPKKPVPIVIPDRSDEPVDDGIVLFFHPEVPEATLVLVRELAV